ncbi:hypothetical protein SAMN05421541_109487 [Actinoplanes philippinensis]|uniref:Uncharacterized protein n=1 Tax=Actinoplanes philippinensis TaxID=35752 RepID=A0A1I2IF59_9ACTN|nr:hypothetical protein SAMN05421541_109487 [Actinoplanes philippinensis]
MIGVPGTRLSPARRMGYKRLVQKPTLVVVSGPPGAGKTTLAHRPGLDEIVAFAGGR